VEGVGLTQSKEKLKARVSALEQETEELEMELSALEARVAGLATPLTNGITRDEEQMIVPPTGRPRVSIVFRFCSQLRNTRGSIQHNPRQPHNVINFNRMSFGLFV
jgi:hypothetical protein